MGEDQRRTGAVDLVVDRDTVAVEHGHVAFPLSQPFGGQHRERGAQLTHEQIRLFEGGEVTAAVELVPVPDVGVLARRPPPAGTDDLVRVDAAAGRHRDEPLAELAEALPVEPRRRCRRRREPVHRDVVEQLVAGQRVLDVVTAVRPPPELLEDPRRLSGRRVDQAVADRLGPRALLFRVAGVPVLVELRRLDRLLLLRREVGQQVGRRPHGRHVGVDRLAAAEVLGPDHRRHRRAPVAALGDERVVAEHGHQLVPCGGDPFDTPSGALSACRSTRSPEVTG